MIHNNKRGQKLRKRLAAAGLSLAMLLSMLPADVMYVQATEKTAEVQQEETNPSSEETEKTGSEQDGKVDSDSEKAKQAEEADSDSEEAKQAEESDSDSEDAKQGEEADSDSEDAEQGKENADESEEADVNDDAEEIENDETTDSQQAEESEGMILPILPEIEVMELPETEEQGFARTQKMAQSVMANETFPSSFDSRKNNLITSVKDQNPYGTCWSFSFSGSMEAGAIRDGLATKGSIDLAERHLSYFACNSGYDALDNSNDDSVVQSSDTVYLNSGGNAYNATMRLMNWQGSAAESSYPYSNSGVPAKIDRSKAQDTVLHLKNSYLFSTAANTAENRAASRTVVKSLLMKYGAVDWSYYHMQDRYGRDDPDCYNAKNGAYYNYKNTGTNHAILIVGWDDNYSKSNFVHEPSIDGAWIVKNSWSPSWGDKGYFYVSYDDISMGSGNPAFVTEVSPANDYDHNYFYGNTIAWQFASGTEFASVFEAKGSGEKEYVKAVSLMTYSSNVSYEIQFYKNPKKVDGVVQDPSSGTAMLKDTVKGTIQYAGLNTIELPSPVEFSHGDDMVVDIKFDGNVSMFADGNYKRSGYIGSNYFTIESTNACHQGQSFTHNYYGWYDLAKESSPKNARINLLTVDTTDKYPTPEVKVSVTDATDFTMGPIAELTWGVAKDALSYDVYRAIGTVSFVKIGSTENGKYTDDTLPLGTEKATYKVTVHYENKDATSEPVEAVFKTDLEGPILTVTRSKDGTAYGCEWDLLKGADGYELEYRKQPEDILSDTGYQKLYATKVNTEKTYEIESKDLTSGIYDVRVRAYRNKWYSQWTRTSFFHLGAIKLDQVSSDSAKQAKLEWTPAKGVEGYNIYRYEVPADTKDKQFKEADLDDVTFKEIKVLNGDLLKEYADTTVKPGARYYYKISAFVTEQNAKVESALSEPVGTAVCAAAPKLSVTIEQQTEQDKTDSKNVALLTFAKAEGALTYTVEKSTDGKIYKELAKINADTEEDYWVKDHYEVRDDAITIGTRYYYRVLSYGIDLDGSKMKKGEVSNVGKALVLSETQKETTYTVTFSMQTDSMEDVIVKGVEAGSNVEQPEIDEREGYIFAGWFKESTYQKAWDFDKDIVDSDVTLYAKWVLKLGEEALEADVIADCTYTGKALKPVVKVYQNGTLLKSGKDYSIAYANNIAVNATRKKGTGFAANTDDRANFDATLPFAVISGKGNYQGNLYINFNINAVPFMTGNTLTKGVTIKCNEQNLVNMTKDIKPLVFVKFGKNLVEGQDYETTIRTSENSYDAAGSKLAADKALYGNTIPAGYTGTYELTVQGIGNFSGAIHKEIHIAAADKMISKAAVALGSKCKKATYTGKNITLTPAWYDAVNKVYLEVKDGKVTTVEVDKNEVYTVKIGKEYLVADRDFAVEYSHALEAGKATMTIKGIGAYSGSKAVTFQIAGFQMTQKNLSVLGGFESTLSYTGAAVTQSGMKLQVSMPDETRTLVYGKDYKLSYKNNVNKGTATVTVMALPKSGLTGNVAMRYKIAEVDLNSSGVSGASGVFNAEYDKAGANINDKIAMTYQGRNLVAGRDYTVAYRNNKAVASAYESKAPCAVVKGKGNFKGTKEVYFNIEKRKMSNEQITVNVTPVVYNAAMSEDAVYPVNLKATDGKAVLKQGKDYTIINSGITNKQVEAYLKLWKDCYEAGKATPKEVEAAKPCVTVAAGENSNYVGQIKVEVPVYQGSLPTDKLYIVQESADSSYQYTGKQICPDLEIYYCEDAEKLAAAKQNGERNEKRLLTTYGMKKWTKNVHYSVSYGANTAIGTGKGSIVIAGKAPLYNGTCKESFHIVRKVLTDK